MLRQQMVERVANRLYIDLGEAFHLAASDADQFFRSHLAHFPHSLNVVKSPIRVFTMVFYEMLSRTR